MAGGLGNPRTQCWCLLLIQGTPLERQGKLPSCGGLNENGPQNLLCLNTCSSVSETVWEGLRRCGLVGEGVLLGVGFEVWQVHIIPS